jgi:hypothetical protein
MKICSRFRLFTLLVSFGLVSVVACDEDPPKPEINQVTLELTHKVGSEVLALTTGQYVNPHQEPYTVNGLIYYLSNVKLNQTGQSTTFSEPESYHLVNETKPASKNILITKLTPGTYNELEFSIGVDQVRNHADNTTGDLNPGNSSGMHWTWSSGYKFLVFHGHSDASQSPSKSFQYHIADDAAYRTVKIALPAPLVITGSSKHLIKISADINQLLASPQGDISFAASHDEQGATVTTLKMADSYPRVFSVTEVQNQ